MLDLEEAAILELARGQALAARPFHFRSGAGSHTLPHQAHGNNDFYVGRDGYSPAAGIGTLNVTDFAEALKRIF